MCVSSTTPPTRFASGVKRVVVFPTSGLFEENDIFIPLDGSTLEISSTYPASNFSLPHNETVPFGPMLLITASNSKSSSEVESPAALPSLMWISSTSTPYFISPPFFLNTEASPSVTALQPPIGTPGGPYLSRFFVIPTTSLDETSSASRLSAHLQKEFARSKIL